MTKKKRRHVDDLRAAGKLVVEATKGVTSLVEEMHRTIASGPAILGSPLQLPARLLTSVVYGGIRGTTDVVGLTLDGALDLVAPLLGESHATVPGKAVMAALNGVLGDYLESTGNALAIPMTLRVEPKTASPESPGGTKLLLLVHGSSMSDEGWKRGEHDHGEQLAEDLGFTAIYLNYNSGRHISTNGAEFADCLEKLVTEWPTPIDEIVVVAHSMGGLVARSACDVAEARGHDWRSRLRAMVFLGTPHHGSPLEQAGNWFHVLLGVSRYSAPFKQLAKIRSAGVTDLRFGNVLDEHWEGIDRFDLSVDERTPLPLPNNVACFAVAGTLSKGSSPPDGSPKKLRGDGLVPLDSALGRHPRPELNLSFPTSHQWIGEGLGHLDLLDDGPVYQQILRWLGEDGATTDAV